MTEKKDKKNKPTWGKNLTAQQRFVLSRDGSKSKTTNNKKGKTK